MERTDGLLVVSPTDLVGFLACGHLTALDLERADGQRSVPVDLSGSEAEDGDLAVLQRRGLDHEASYLEWLKGEGRTVAEVPDSTGDDRVEGLRSAEAETLAAMQSGVDVIFQATFLDESDTVAWRGHADFLVRVDRPSALGAFSYEPEDTKLARRIKASAVLQLCEYAQQVDRLQGAVPDQVHVVLGNMQRDSVRLVEVAAYHRSARRRFLESLDRAPAVYPVPVGHCPMCRWEQTCIDRREADDHLCRVARLSREQARKLEAAGVSTLAALASTDDEFRVHGIGSSTLIALRRQARLQHVAVADQPPPVEPLPVVEGRGLAALPAPDPGDLFYDIEGDPHVGDDGIEYLHGLGWLDDDADFVFRPWWAHTPAEEKHAFEQLIDFITERRRAHPDMHVYHYASYEVNALGKLMGRYGTREAELDQLLRGEVFVDLYRVVRQGMAVGSPSYSIKKLEPLYMPARTGEVTDAGSSIVEYERWLDTAEQSVLDAIEAYNRDDVESTWLLRDWLEAQRDGLVSSGVTVDRPTIGDSLAEQLAEGDDDEVDEIDLLADRLLDDLDDVAHDDEDEASRVRRLMANLLRWHQREAKPEWWKFFERVLHLDHDALFDDTECLAGLTLVGDATIDGRSNIWTYEFDADQEHKLSAGTRVVDPVTQRQKLEGETIETVGTIHRLDPAAGVIELRRGVNNEAPHPTALVPDPGVRTEPLTESLCRVAGAVLEHGVDGSGPAAAARQLLGERTPRVDGVEPGDPLRKHGEATLEAAIRLARGLDRSVLPIQGPPGSGKTYTASNMICALLADGHIIGVTGNSHAVVSNLLKAVLEQAAKHDVDVRAVQKPNDDDGVEDPRVVSVRSNPAVLALLEGGEVNLVAGTAWLFAREELAERLHTLVVDEAGQLSLANVVAVAPAADNLVLVGDPQQLAQPSKGTHPPGAGVSGLDHVLKGAATVPPDLGLFLDRTWRMHPAITTFISEQVYADELQSHPRCQAQTVAEGPVVGGSGLRWLPVEHEGNRTSSVEEAEAVRATVEALVGRPWTDCEGTTTPLGPDDILVVAPYNAQVRLLSSHLPDGIQVGTVDKFQGKEAAVVVVSMAASGAEHAPRGMDFLYSRNRINVAVSRAQALAVLVGAPALLTVTCRTVSQMKLANVLCRYVELADDVQQ